MILSLTAFFPAVHILNIIPVPRGISCCLNVEMISFGTITVYYVGICVDRQRIGYNLYSIGFMV